MVTRRALATGFMAFLSGASLTRVRSPAPPVKPANGPSLVPTGVDRADAAWSGGHDMVRAERFSPGGPPVDMLYEIVPNEPVDDPTRLALGDGRWGRQVFPTGILNARAFGAVGDGVTDDTMAMQDFLDAVVNAGAKGFIPAGTYRVTAPLRIGGDYGKDKYRGFTIEGAGRTGLNGKRAIGGTLILLDAPRPAEAVVLWYGAAWRDARFTGIGLASMTPDGATYGLLVRSSEVSQLEFDHLHVENVTIAFALLAGTGANGEFCGWSNIQTWNVRDFFFSDAGQAFGMRFTNIFCYYRPGGTLFRFAPRVVGGGLHLTNFDASPVAPAGGAPAQRADTTIFSLSDKHNAPITVIGGRFEHITTLAEIDTGSVDIIVHNQIQFIGSEFTTDLDKSAVAAGRGTVILKNQALADINFLNCSFATAFPSRDDEMVQIQANPGCRGTIRFDQCGHWGYAGPPAYAGPSSQRLRIIWRDCTVNDAKPGADYRGRAFGGRFERSINDTPQPGTMKISDETGRLMHHDGDQWVEMPRTLVGLHPPAAGRFHPGDVCRNAAPARGAPLAWVCVEGGSPGRWQSSSLL